jgi:hypothetical protein
MWTTVDAAGLPGAFDEPPEQAAETPNKVETAMSANTSERFVIPALLDSLLSAHTGRSAARAVVNLQLLHAYSNVLR